MADDDYEILPHSELEYLRHEVEKLKKSPYGDTETGETLLDSMNNLTSSINRLLAVFETANEEIIADFEDTKLSKRVERLTEQNEKLAVGIVAIGELVKEVLAQQSVAGTADLEAWAQANAPAPEPEQPTQATATMPVDAQPLTSAEQSPFAAMETEQALTSEIPSVKGMPRPPKEAPGMPPQQSSELPPPPKDSNPEPDTIDDVPLPPQ